MNIYKRHRFPPDIISYAVWLYHRFNLSHRDIEDLLAQRGITVSREAIRLWCIKFGAIYTRRLKRKHRGYGDTFYIDEVFVKINGMQHYLWRAVDQDGEVVDVFLQARRDGAAAKRFFKRFPKSMSWSESSKISKKKRTKSRNPPMKKIVRHQSMTKALRGKPMKRVASRMPVKMTSELIVAALITLIKSRTPVNRHIPL